METLDYKHNLLTVEHMHSSHRRGSGHFKPVKKLISGLRAHKSSEELDRTGRSSPRATRKHADVTYHLGQPISDGHRNASVGDLPRHSQGGSSSRPHGSPGTHRAAAPIIQVQTPSPTLSRHTCRDNMKKSLTDSSRPAHKRRRSPLSKQPHPDAVGGTPTSSDPRRPSRGATGQAALDGALLSDGPQSVDESENLPGVLQAESGASMTLVAMTTNGGSASDATGEGEDSHDGGLSQAQTDENRKRQTIQHLEHKMRKTFKLINEEQNAKEEHVNEYLRLSTSADKQQGQRIKTIFEKKNQKSAQTLAALQKKVETYKKKIADIEHFGISQHKQPKEVLKDVGQGLKDMGANIKEFSGGVVDNIRGAKESMISKPKDFAHGFFKNKKFGSADNIHNIKLEESQGSTDDGDKRSHHGSGTLPPRKPHTLPTYLPAPRYAEFVSEEEAAPSDVTSESAVSATHSSPHQTLQTSGNVSQLEAMGISHYFEQITRDLDDQKELQGNLQTAIQHVEDMQSEIQEQFTQLNRNLEDERYRRERLEEQINDLTELHQNEVPNIRQDLVSMEEKMEYKLDERTEDLQDLLESCQTRISKMDMAQQQQQLISMEGIDNSNFRALIVKLLNVVLAVVGVVLVFVSTLANLLGPFLTTRVRILSTVALIACMVALWQNWHSVRDTGRYYYERYSHIIPFR